MRNLTHELLSRCITGYITFCYRTARWSWEGFEALEDDIAHGRSRVICSWHNRLALISYCRDWKTDPLTILTSYHRDAALAADGFRRRGLTVIELRTSGDNTGPIKETVRRLRQGSMVGLTPDGPMGPRAKAKAGAITIAALAQVPICALSYSLRPRGVLKTWDRFVVPIPFARGSFVITDGFVPPRKLDEATLEACRMRLEQDINETTERSDQMVDVPILGSPRPKRRSFRSAVSSDQATSR